MIIAAVVTIAALPTQDELGLPAFPTRWPGLRAGEVERDRGRIGFLAPGSEKTSPSTEVTLVEPPIERALRFRIGMRCSVPDGAARILISALGKDGQTLMRRGEHIDLPRGRWIRGEVNFCPPLGTARVRLSVINRSVGVLELARPSLTDHGPLLYALNGSGLLRASGYTRIRGTEGTAVFPIPAPTAEQAPIAFRLRAEPASGLKRYAIKRREGGNWVCEATVTPPKGRAVSLRWESLVLVRDLPPSPPPPVPLAPAAPHLMGWLASTPVAQADDLEVAAKAMEIREGSKDLEDLARRVIRFTSTNQGDGRPFVSLDAAAAMGCGGSCTSRANLAVALFRAAGVPARSVAHLPTWAYGSLLYQHWLTEYWHPGAGWIRVEPTLGKYMPRPSTFATLAVSSISDEKRAGSDGQYRWIMPGAAWMSSMQGSSTLEMVGTEDELSRNWCRAERRMPVSERLLRAAKAAWPPSPIRFREREAIALNGNEASLIRAVQGAR